MLQVVIGIIFVLLLLSLLATTVMELISSVFSLRGRNLEWALKNMLASTDIDEKILAAFKENSLYRQLAFKGGRKQDPTRKPSYISDSSFQSILFDVILKGEGTEKLESKIEELPDEDLKKVLKQFLQESEHKVDDFKLKVRGWYNDVMDRASGWYKRFTQKILIGVGMCIAVIFNADTIAIYERLESDPESLQKVVSMAESFVEANDSTTLFSESDADFQANVDQIKTLMDEQIDNVKSPLGLGWKNVEWEKVTLYHAFSKLLGWIVTALAVSMGAPFWFDLLRKIVNVRGSGKVPEKTA